MIKNLSPKQIKVLTWWTAASHLNNKNGIICDGAVRSGKSISMGISFVIWAMKNFNFKTFALCGKTLPALRRNIVTAITPYLEANGFMVVDDCMDELEPEPYIIIEKNGVINYFYLYGARDEECYRYIAEKNFSGALFDEVTLMSRAFVEQVVARCYVENAKWWFTCNPESPYHWFYNEWINKAEDKNVIYLRFTMDDNPSLSDEAKERYKKLYTGAFYQRFITGEWTEADGLVYTMFGDSNIATAESFDEYYLSCDYGTVNPFSLGLWGKCNEKWYRIDEFYYSSRDAGRQFTDEEYYDELKKLAAGRSIKAIIMDPSAASFIEVIRHHGEYAILKANNSLDGINAVADALNSHKIYISPNCNNAIREFSLYKWANDGRRTLPVKANDHAMDDIRYFVQTVLGKEER